MNAETPLYRVSELNAAVRDLLETAFTRILVEGEISNLARPASGHLYFSLKDEGAAVSCALFKGSRFRLKLPWSRIENGLLVRVHARVSVYAPRGQYQLIIEALEAAGRGRLEREYRERLQRLTAEGLFAAARKRPLPRLPRCVGIVTSTSGAAVHDALTTLARRNPALAVVIYPAPVQGDEAPARLRAQLENANRRRDCDLLLLMRGGGSLEDLWAFNDEALARAIVASDLPVISGIGHEVDTTLADFAADLRTATPTAAAEHACPPLDEQCATLTRRLGEIERRLTGLCAARRQTLDKLQQHLNQGSPERQLHTRMQRCDEYRARLDGALRKCLHRRRETLRFLKRRLSIATPADAVIREREILRLRQTRLFRGVAAKLRQERQRQHFLCQSMAHLNPLAVFARGYALVQDEQGRIIRCAAEVAAHSRIRVSLAQGRLYATVEQRKLR